MTYTLDCAAGAYDFVGATSQRDLSFVVGAGAYDLTGVAAGLAKQGRVAGTLGTCVLTGKAAGLVRGRKITAATGSYLLTGQAAQTRPARKLIAAVGSCALVGRGAALTGVGEYALVCEAGALALTVDSANITAQRGLAALADVYSLSGVAAGLAVVVPEQPESTHGIPQSPGFHTSGGFLGRPRKSNRMPTPPRQSGPLGFLRKYG